MVNLAKSDKPRDDAEFRNESTDLEVAVELMVGAVLAGVRGNHHEDGEAVNEDDGDDVIERSEVVLLPAHRRRLDDCCNQRAVVCLLHRERQGRLLAMYRRHRR